MRPLIAAYEMRILALERILKGEPLEPREMISSLLLCTSNACFDNLVRIFDALQNAALLINYCYIYEFSSAFVPTRSPLKIMSIKI